MREQVEKKLGCTIEEYLDRIKMLIDQGGVAELPNPFKELTEEEADFLVSFETL